MGFSVKIYLIADWPCAHQRKDNNAEKIQLVAVASQAIVGAMAWGLSQRLDSCREG